MSLHHGMNRVLIPCSAAGSFAVQLVEIVSGTVLVKLSVRIQSILVDFLAGLSLL